MHGDWHPVIRTTDRRPRRSVPRSALVGLLVLAALAHLDTQARPGGHDAGCGPKATAALGLVEANDLVVVDGDGEMFTLTRLETVAESPGPGARGVADDGGSLQRTLCRSEGIRQVALTGAVMGIVVGLGLLLGRLRERVA